MDEIAAGTIGSATCAREAWTEGAALFKIDGAEGSRAINTGLHGATAMLEAGLDGLRLRATTIFLQQGIIARPSFFAHGIADEPVGTKAADTIWLA